MCGPSTGCLGYLAVLVVCQERADLATHPDDRPRRARDIVWTLISPEVYELLVIDRDWSPDEYEQWLAQALADALTAPRP